MPNVYLIGGPNGSGKTTIAKRLLPNFLGVIEYVNADEIAAGLSPFNPASVAISAGRLMLERLVMLKTQKVDFAFESTLAARNFARFLRDCQSSGYRINLIYIWLQTPDLALERVRTRVASGGHHIPEDVVRRRYERGRINLTQLYLPLCDTWIVYDNSREAPSLVAKRPLAQQTMIYSPSIWQQITEVAHD
jgi:predicted ABC-type ATPase